MGTALLAICRESLDHVFELLENRVIKVNQALHGHAPELKQMSQHTSIAIILSGCAAFQSSTDGHGRV